VILTDSGTSALVVALRLLVGRGTVALPAFACVDLIAAARRADVQVLLYDVDPHTLSPDLESVRQLLAEDVTAIVVAHLYGYPADVPAVRELARQTGTAVIEDAAQHAGATLRGARAGALGDVTVLSFGRGKGTTAGRGGALLNFGETALDGTTLHAASGGYADLLGSVASWTLGRPSLYALPSAIPGLHLGETVYHAAHEPRMMSRPAAALLTRTLRAANAATVIRHRNATTLRRAGERSHRLDPITPIVGGKPGYLRLPVSVRAGSMSDERLGVVRSYPRSLSDEDALQPILKSRGDPLPGAHELARRLVTLPTHHMLNQHDLAQLAEWMT
jgi:dTDP-4-amino-4,6-dideoxygalactose transaminase